MRKRAPAVALILGVALGAWMMLSHCGRTPGAPGGNGLFSWHSAVLEDPERLFAVMERLNLTELYQAFPADTPDPAVRAFTAAAAERGITVYLLAGEPEWGRDPTGEHMIETVRRAGDLGLSGVMMDVESHLLEEWDVNRGELLETYVQGMRRARTAARRAGLSLIACIPYYYDGEDTLPALETLADKGCDGLAVMNYYRTGEIEHLETEAALAERYGRGLIHIYELQAPGRYGLTEKNTYFGLGLEALAESRKALEAAYPGIRFALHEFDALEEVLSDE